MESSNSEGPLHSTLQTGPDTDDQPEVCNSVSADQPTSEAHGEPTLSTEDQPNIPQTNSMNQSTSALRSSTTAASKQTRKRKRNGKCTNI